MLLTNITKLNNSFSMDIDYLVYFVLYIVVLTLGLLINVGIFVILQKWNAGKMEYYFFRFVICLNIIYCLVSTATLIEHARNIWGPIVPCHHNLTLKGLYTMIIAIILDFDHVVMVAYFYEVYLRTGSDLERTRKTKIYIMVPYIILAILTPPNLAIYFSSVNDYLKVENSANTRASYVCNYVFSSSAMTFHLIFSILKISVCTGFLIYIFFGMIRFAAIYSSLAVNPCVIDSVATTIIGQMTTQVKIIKKQNITYESTRKIYRRKALILFSLVLIYFLLIFPMTFHRIIHYSRCKLGFYPSFATPSKRITTFLEMLCSILLPILFVLSDKNLRKFISIKSR
ncbi:unnamed protein product [Gordionus sp. m RMFG-2023]